MPALMPLLGKIGLSLISSLLTETVIKKLVILLLEKLAASSENKVDDEVIKVIKDALEV